MKEENSKNKATENTSKAVPGDTDKKTSLGGDVNSGVTSGNPATKDAIEKKGTMLEDQPPSEKDDKKEKGTPNHTDETIGVP